MPNQDDINHTIASVKIEKDGGEIINKTFADYLALALATFGVGYIPLAPGTWGSAIGVLIYIVYVWAEKLVNNFFISGGRENPGLTAWDTAANLALLLLFCFLGIWAAGRAATVFQKKDPQKVVVDEVMGQLIVFLFVPLAISWKLILAGFLLFRLFDIWKPYPVNEFESLPKGLGICADDIMAGIYGGIVLSLLYAISLDFQIYSSGSSFISSLF